jgi:hypothetical protein
MVNPRKIVYINIRKLALGRVLLCMLALSVFIFTAETSNIITTRIQVANAAINDSDKPGNVVNSDFLSITDHKYRTGQFSDTITGTITNNSTQEISSVSVYVALYNKDNKLLTMDSGSVSISPLRAGDNSPFTINVASFSNVKDKIDHYTIFPGGTPS